MNQVRCISLDKGDSYLFVKVDWLWTGSRIALTPFLTWTRTLAL